MKKSALLMALLLPSAAMAQHWTAPDTYDYPNETPVYATVYINGAEAGPNDGLELAAFIGDDCRADATEITYPSPTAAINGRYTLRVMGNLDGEANADITFRALYLGVEYEFTTQVPFTGETETPVPLVLNLDAVTAVSIPQVIEITQPASAFPYTEDLTSKISLLYEGRGTTVYTPKNESKILSEVTYKWSSRNANLLTFSGNKLTVNAAQNASVPGSLEMTVSTEGYNPLTFTASTTFTIAVATVPVTGISCSLTKLEVFAFEDVMPYFEGKVTVQPSDATDKGFYLDCQTNYFGNNMFNRSGKYTLLVYPSDASYNGDPAEVDVTAWMRPSNISTTAWNNVVYVGIGENVYDVVSELQRISYPVNNPGDYVKDEVSYKFSADGYVDTKGKAIKEGEVELTVTLAEGITEMATAEGSDSYTVTVIIESRISVRMDFGATNFTKDGTVSTDPIAYVYVANPGNEPFDPTTDLTLNTDYRYDGYPYAVLASVSEFERDDTEEGETCYALYILPLFAGNEINFTVQYKGEPIEDDSPINITNVKKLAAGWNWISMPTVISANGTSVDDVFTQNDIIEIRSQLGLLYNDSTYGYFGDIQRLFPTEATYKVKTNKATTAQLGSETAFDANQNYANLKHGYNWLNNPYEFDIPANRISECLNNPDAPFKPSDGDMIITRDAFAVCQDGEWVAADDFALKDGEGLVYYRSAETSENGDAIIFDEQFAPDFEIVIPESTGGGNVKAYNPNMMHPAEEFFQYDKHAFADNMAMVAVVEGVENPEDYTLGVFVGDECRGRGKVVRDDIMFVNAVGKAGEILTFKLMNNATGEVMSLDATTTYSLQKGSLQSPFILSAGNVTGIGRLAADGQQESVIYDLSGRRVDCMQKGIYVINGKKVLK